MAHEQERMQILELIESGKISAQDGLRLLEALGGPQEAPALEAAPAAAPVEPATYETANTAEGAGEVFTPAAEDVIHPRGAASIPEEIEKWRRWWQIPFWVGMGITLLGALLLFAIVAGAGVTFWFFLAALPFFFGVAVMAIAWQSRSSHWIHIRIQQKPGASPQRIALSFPLPIRPATWFLRNFGHHIPPLRGTSIDELIMAVGSSTTPQNPLYVEVNEGEDGEHVEIYIG